MCICLSMSISVCLSVSIYLSISICLKIISLFYYLSFLYCIVLHRLHYSSFTLIIWFCSDGWRMVENGCFVFHLLFLLRVMHSNTYSHLLFYFELYLYIKWLHINTLPCIYTVFTYKGMVKVYTSRLSLLWSVYPVEVNEMCSHFSGYIPE